MAKKPKKKLTTKQEQTKHRTLQYVAVGGMFGSILTPFIILAAMNYEEWFQSSGGWKITTGGALALAVVGIAIALVTFKKEKESKITDGWITILVFWFAIAFIVKLLEQIYAEIFTVMMWTGLGLAGAFGLNILSLKEKENADKIKAAREKAVEETIQEEAKEEIKKEKESLPVD